MHSYNVQPIFWTIQKLSVRLASRHSLKFHGEASDWLSEQDGCLLLIQTVEGRNGSIRFWCLKVGGGRCNPDEKGIWCDRWESEEYHDIGRMPDIDLANSYSSLKDYVGFDLPYWYRLIFFSLLPMDTFWKRFLAFGGIFFKLNTSLMLPCYSLQQQ